MEPDYTSLPYIITNAVAIVIVISAMMWPTVSRVLLSVMFIGASIFNLVTSFTTPSAYLELGEFSTNDFYRSFIFGPFSTNVPLYVSGIAIGQLLIGVFVLYKGKLMKAALIGGIIFLLGISPLGYGSAFPSPVIFALAFAILLHRDIQFDIFKVVLRKRRKSATNTVSNPDDQGQESAVL
jgi:hypothetical protein